jgi:hypothetical protein
MTEFDYEAHAKAMQARADAVVFGVRDGEPIHWEQEVAFAKAAEKAEAEVAPTATVDTTHGEDYELRRTLRVVIDSDERHGPDVNLFGLGDERSTVTELAAEDVREASGGPRTPTSQNPAQEGVSKAAVVYGAGSDGLGSEGHDAVKRAQRYRPSDRVVALRCERCNSVIQGKRSSKRFCAKSDDPVCFKARRAEERRVARNSR